MGLGHVPGRGRTLTIKVFFLFFWGRSLFESFFLEVFFFFPEGRISFLIYLVEVPLFLLPLKVIGLVIVLVFLGLFFKIVVEACDYRDQIYLII
jgi:hypothetical protein